MTIHIEDDELMTPNEVAAAFRVAPDTVAKWARADPPKLESIRTPGGHRRYRRSVVNARLRGEQPEGSQ